MIQIRLECNISKTVGDAV